MSTSLDAAIWEIKSLHIIPHFSRIVQTHLYECVSRDYAVNMTSGHVQTGWGCAKTWSSPTRNVLLSFLLPLAKMCSVQDNITADACFVLFFQSRLSIILGKCHGNSYIILVISCHVSWWRWNQIIESVMQVILDLDLDLGSLSLDLQTCIQQYTLLRKLSLLHVRFIHQTFRKGDIQIQNRPPTPRRCGVCGNWIHFIQGGEECFWGLPIILLRPREERWVKGSFFYLGEGADCCQVNLIKWKQSGWQHVLICISNENVLVP